MNYYTKPLIDPKAQSMRFNSNKQPNKDIENVQRED